MAKPTGPAQPKASKPQSAVGQLQAVAQYNRSVIMGKTKSEDGSWVKGKLASWRPVVYSVDEPTSQEYLHIPVNKGKEAMPYLTYIIDYYDDLSDINVFAHAHEKAWPQAWHNELLGGDYSIVTMLERLQLENVRKSGYVNLRCNGTPGCPAELHPTRKDFKKDSIEIGFRKLWEHLYGNRLFPSEVGVACCAQFAVTRERIRERPKAFYESVRSWILWTDEQDPGRTLEYFWHIIFGMPPVHCDSNYNQCICKTFGCGAAW
ncbi:hypothetical protein DRE_00203 [Drechslerella stenobrocha 248]|uniref:Uncharacterized protein n=1 Tax=Drechslerella stenobrocha 248 TaxID=1043628 RepID=W7I991_9PEZI|nr:hypothetical protein DRE_00203 [Drechslerella stenobrocha 248]